MKRIILTFICLLLICVPIISFISCGEKLSGVYYCDDISGMKMTFAFSEDGTCTQRIIQDNIDVTFQGTYEIDGEIFTFTTDQGEKRFASMGFSKGSDEKGEYITFLHDKFYKQ